MYVTKRSEYCVEYRGSGLPQKVCAVGKTSNLERLGLFGCCVWGAETWGYSVPLIPEVVLDFIGCGECTKESVSIHYLSSILAIRPIKSCNVKMRQ